MGRYRKINTGLWNDQKIRRLSLEGRLFFLYLLTSPHSTSWGAYLLDDLYVQADIGLALPQIKKCWAEVVSERLANRDEATRLVCFPNWFRYNPPENAKTAAACIRGILELPKSATLSTYCSDSEWISEQFANRNLTLPGRLDGEHGAQSTEKERKKLERKKVPQTDSEWFDELRKNPAYQHVEFPAEMARLDAWLSANPRRKKTRRFIVNWLNRIDAPVTIVPEANVGTEFFDTEVERARNDPITKLTSTMVDCSRCGVRHHAGVDCARLGAPSELGLFGKGGAA